MKIEKRNAYICEECRYVTLTVHIHEGVTPMMILCRNPRKCRSMAISFYYTMPGVLAMPSASGKLKPTHEWYKPTEDEMATPGFLSPGEIEHINNGGVLLRERTTAEPLTKLIEKP